MNYKITVYILCGLALIISIIALCVAVYRTPELSFDYQGVLVGVLSLLVTVLLGWSIFSLIDIKKIREEMDSFKAISIFNAEANNYITCHAVSDVFYAFLVGDKPLSFGQQFIYYRISQLLHASLMNDLETCNIVVKTLLQVIAKPESIKVTKAGKQDIIKLMSKIQPTDKIQGYVELLGRVAELHEI